MAEKNTILADIVSNSIDDGPGVRTVIFMKGCPLNCVWCHNPEYKATARELFLDLNRCINCNLCVEHCPQGASGKTGTTRFITKNCIRCFACADHCPSGALKIIGLSADFDDICTRVKQDSLVFKYSGGGVTISGGEPTLHMDFLSDLTQSLKKIGIHVLLETCGFFDYELFQQKVLPYVDEIYFDLKFIEAVLHTQYCGVSNARILNNARLLWETGRSKGVKISFRTPLVPGITATVENISMISKFLSELGVEQLHLLPYNPLWKNKTLGLGIRKKKVVVSPLDCWMEYGEIDKMKQVVHNKGLVVM